MGLLAADAKGLPAADAKGLLAADFLLLYEVS
jgi:hypothetical protein